MRETDLRGWQVAPHARGMTPAQRIAARANLPSLRRDKVPPWNPAAVRKALRKIEEQPKPGRLLDAQAQSATERPITGHDTGGFTMAESTYKPFWTCVDREHGFACCGLRHRSESAAWKHKYLNQNKHKETRLVEGPYEGMSDDDFAQTFPVYPPAHERNEAWRAQSKAWTDKTRKPFTKKAQAEAQEAPWKAPQGVAVPAPPAPAGPIQAAKPIPVGAPAPAPKAPKAPKVAPAQAPAAAPNGALQALVRKIVQEEVQKIVAEELQSAFGALR